MFKSIFMRSNKYFMVGNYTCFVEEANEAHILNNYFKVSQLDLQSDSTSATYCFMLKPLTCEL